MADEPKGVLEYPRFERGTVVTTSSMVIDLDGIAWWVRPDPMVCIRVSPAQLSNPAQLSDEFRSEISKDYLGQNNG